jgi:hypothetical protein
MGRILYKGNNYYDLQSDGRRKIHAMLPKNIKGRIVSGIYMLSFGNYFYIGRSSNIKDRVRNHIQALDKLLSKERVSNKYQKSMFNFLMNNPKFNIIEVKILEECEEGELNEREQHWIDINRCSIYLMNGTLKAARTFRDRVWAEFDSSVLYPIYFKVDKFEDYLQYKKLLELKDNININKLFKK